MKIIYQFAGIPVEAIFQYSDLEKQCVHYVCEEKPLFSVTVTESDIEYERAKSEADVAYTQGYLETLAFYRKFAEMALNYNVLLFHGSAIIMDGKAYVYTAPSGTGKSTHTKLCKDVFGERMCYLNDDKPLLRFLDGEWRVYGTPWDGKHHRSTNASAPLGGICRLSRGLTNEIHRENKEDALATLLSQTYRPTDGMAMQKVLCLVMSLSETALWHLHCNMEREAAVLSLGAMMK